MRRSQKVSMAVALAALTGYGAWALYKKYNPDYMRDLENSYRRITRDAEKAMDDMM